MVLLSIINISLSLRFFKLFCSTVAFFKPYSTSKTASLCPSIVGNILLSFFSAINSSLLKSISIELGWGTFIVFCS